MNKQQLLYDVYVSYPPSVDHDRVDACIRDNLPDTEAEDLIAALESHPQAIIAEQCTREERENAQHYFSYLGLDVIIRLSLELAPDGTGQQEKMLAEQISQCPVCHAIIENPDAKECPTCGTHFGSLSESILQRKRIEWQERVAFENRKQHEIAQKLQQEKQEEEKRLRKQIRAELEEQLRAQNGINRHLPYWLRGKKGSWGISFVIFAILVLLGCGYLIARIAS